MGQQQGARTGARRGQRGFGAGMAAADHDHVVLVEVAHGARNRESGIGNRESTA
ncbi:hypothetical protein [Lysobacter gummosus]|uniref:hypothetical protein n=1 Tax=Lysobacter gummosus TaxID=262324 RepID=UPI00363239FA